MQKALLRQHSGGEAMAQGQIRGGLSTFLKRWLGGKTPREVYKEGEPCSSRRELTISGAETV